MIKTLITSILTTAILSVIAFYYLPVFSINKIQTEQSLGASLTEISGTDTMSSFPTIYNDNLSALNSAKIEVSTTTLPNITTLSSLTTIGTIGTGVWQGTDVGVAYGGTGASTLGSNLVLLGNGTGAIQTVSAGSNDQVLTLVAGVPEWTSTVIDETDNYTWTGQHSWTSGTTTFNSASDFNSTVSLDGYTSVASLQIASSSTNQYPTASTSIATKGYIDSVAKPTYYVDNGAFGDCGDGICYINTLIEHNLGIIPEKIVLSTFGSTNLSGMGVYTESTGAYRFAGSDGSAQGIQSDSYIHTTASDNDYTTITWNSATSTNFLSRQGTTGYEVVWILELFVN